MWPLFDLALNSTVPLKDKVMYLNLMSGFHKLSLEKETDITLLKEKIQELISSPITRFEGYLFMDALMTNHPTIYIHNWGPIIIGSLKCSDGFVSNELTLRILKHVVVNFSGNTSCAEAFHRFIPEILPMLLQAEQNDVGFVYNCQALAMCMQHMPAILGPHSDEIELFLMKHVDSISYNITEAIADCFAAFPVCLGNFQKPKPFFMDVWLEVYVKTLNTLQALLNDILKFPEVENCLVNVEGLSLFKIPFDPTEEEFSYVLARVRIFSSLCKCLAKMMSVRIESNLENIRVQVPVHDLLQCLERIFKVKEIIKVKQLPKCSVFLFGYPIMQNAVLVVLEALIVNFTIIEQSGNFAKLLKESIDATALTTFTPSSLRQVRSTTWKTLNIWLKQYGPKGSYEIVNDKFLVQELLKDVALDSDDGQSQVNGTGESPDVFREECCSDALQVLQNMYTVGGSFIDKGLADEISVTILKTVRKIQLYLHPAKKFPYPFINENCRLKLYDCLLTVSLFGDPLQTKYINQAINVFKIAMKDPNLEINAVCHKAFKLSRLFLNPKKLPPETLTYLDVGKTLRPPCEENVLTVWDSGNWNVSNESSQEEKSMEVAPPCQIETVYHNSVESDGQRDLLSVQNSKSPIHYSETHESQCNGNSRLVSSKPPSHSNICNDSGSDEIEEYKEYGLEDTHVMLSVDIPPITQTPTINSIDPQIIESKITNPESKITELKPLEPVILDNSVTTNHHDSSATDVPIKCIDEVEEVPQSRSLKKMTENGMDVESEDEESGDEEDEEGSDEDEEGNETYLNDDAYSPEFYQHDQEAIPDRSSPEYYHQRPLKRRKISNEEEHSSEDYEEEKSSNQNQEMMNQDEESEEEDEEVRQSEEEEEEMPNGSPTVNEMCRDFVLAEPEEIS